MNDVDEHGMHWVLYALGGGMGHLTRIVALARALKRDHARKGSPINLTILTNSRFANILSIGDEIGSDHRLIMLHPDLTRDEVSSHISILLGRLEPDYLVVDTFPRGIGGELANQLPEMRCRKVLVHRDLNPRYITQFNVEEFLHHYDQILIPGESAAFDSQPHAVRTAPWLIRDDEELLTVAEARERLEVDDESLPVVAVLGCGKQEEVEQMCDVAEEIERRTQGRAIVRLITPSIFLEQIQQPVGTKQLDLWPLFECIRGVSVVVGSGGYNTVHESRAAGIPLVAFAWRRLYDRQSNRLSEAELVNNVEEAAGRVESLIGCGDLGATPSQFSNGVHEAVSAIQAESIG